jgi:predicted NBD/HSP70 family sugar kinase
MNTSLRSLTSSKKSFLWGVDLGGTKIEAAIIDLEHRDISLYRQRIPTEAEGGYRHILSQVVRLIEEIEQLSGMKRPEKIGFGTPGIIDTTTNLLKHATNTHCLNKQPLQQDLSKVLSVEAVVANDANCFALAEAVLGAARGKKVIMGLIIGTGVGGGLVVDGRVIEGLHGIAGEWGHNPLSGEEQTCGCGKKGCNETVFSGPALECFYFQQTGNKLLLSDIALRAAGGEVAAEATLQRLQLKFAEAIAIPINILDPDAIVIGGGVGNLDILYTQKTRDCIAKHVLNNNVLKTPFLKPILGDSAGVFGAALLSTKS